jgi:hypothetical protein
LLHWLVWTRVRRSSHDTDPAQSEDFAMSRERIEGTRKHPKEHRKDKDVRPTADGRDGGRPHMGAKSQKTFGIRKD